MSKSIKIKLNNDIESGAYPVTANIFSENGNLMDTKTTSVDIKGCIKSKESGQKLALFASAPKQSNAPKTAKEQIKTQTASITLKEDRNMLLLLLSTLIFTLFFVFTALVLFVGYR